jgi:gas vesicle protein
MSNSTGNTFLALLTGAVIGAGIGILFAPDKDQNQRMKDGFDDVKNELKINLIMPQKNLNKFSTAKLIWKKLMKIWFQI